MHSNIAIFWFRRDLRLHDNPALYELSKLKIKILPIFILDEAASPNYKRKSASEWFLYESLQELSHDVPLRVYEGDTITILRSLMQQYKVSHIFCNKVYEPKELALESEARALGVDFYAAHSQILFKPEDVFSNSGAPFKVFTPFWRKCMEIRSTFELTPKAECDWVPSDRKHFEYDKSPFFWAKDFGKHWVIGENAAQEKLDHFINSKLTTYKHDRDYPSINGTSKLSPYLHFGVLSPKQIMNAIAKVQIKSSAQQESVNCFKSEIGWREFSYHLLNQFPHLDTHNFRKEFDSWQWENDEALFEKWKKGETGIPIVDAGMQELWQTGYMHNRVRMIVASFLTKHLLIDWRKGADYFMETLVDADLANNYASWQWVAGSGADAAPYFRIFNPMLQAQKFDPSAAYIKKYAKPILRPIIDLEFGRKRALERYRNKN